MNERDKELWEQALHDGERFDSAESCFAAIASLIRADEREACAKVCEKLFKTFLSPQYSTGQPLSSFKERFAVGSCVEAIRARGNNVSSA